MITLQCTNNAQVVQCKGTFLCSAQSLHVSRDTPNPIPAGCYSLTNLCKPVQVESFVKLIEDVLGSAMWVSRRGCTSKQIGCQLVTWYWHCLLLVLFSVCSLSQCVSSPHCLNLFFRKHIIQQEANTYTVTRWSVIISTVRVNYLEREK